MINTTPYLRDQPQDLARDGRVAVRMKIKKEQAY
jgi:hypothetical protein